MKYYSVFSGVEAATLAWEPIGWEPLLFCEIDEFPSAVLKHRWPNVPNLGDIKAVNWKSAIKTFGRPDLIVGGSPCQSFSIAGSRTGLDGASGLMWEYVRCVRGVRPDWVLWENVPGALSSSNGEDFRCLLEALDALGYGLAWRVLDAQFFGVAQRRERVFLVGRLGDPDGPCKVLFESESLRWDSPSSREKRKELAAGAGGGAPCAGFRWHQGAGAGALGIEAGQSPTLDTVKPPAVLQLKGNATDVDGVIRMPHDTNVPMTLQVRCGSPGGGGKGALVQVDMSATLSTVQNQTLFEPVAFAANQRGEVRLQGGDGDVVGAIPASRSGKQVQGVAQDYAVRRLTPRECERLQGFPDDHTKVPYRGKPAEECPDTPRYKAIGNSMCVNVMRWIGERIQKVDDELRTAQR